MELFRNKKYKLIETLDELRALHEKNQLFGYQNVAEDVYHAGPGLSQSVLKGYLKSPAHAKMMMSGEKIRTEAMKLGSACHAAVFEPGRFEKEYFTAPSCDRRTKEGKAKWEAILNANPGRELLSEDDGNTIAGILRTLRTHDYFRYVSEGIGFPELSYYWKAGDFLCKARFDWLTTTALPLQEGESRIIFDLKTTEYGITRPEIERTIRGLGYDIQASWYLSAIPDADFVFIFAEKRPPYACAFYQVGPKMRAEGHEKIEELLAIHTECTKKQAWPGHNNGLILGD